MARLAFIGLVIAVFCECAQIQEPVPNASEQVATTAAVMAPEITPYSGLPTYLADVKPLLESRTCLSCHSAEVYEGYCTQNLESLELVRDGFPSIRQNVIERRHRRLNPDTLTAVDRGLLIKWAEDGFP